MKYTLGNLSLLLTITLIFTCCKNHTNNEPTTEATPVQAVNNIIAQEPCSKFVGTYTRVENSMLDKYPIKTVYELTIVSENSLYKITTVITTNDPGLKMYSGKIQSIHDVKTSGFSTMTFILSEQYWTCANSKLTLNKDGKINEIILDSNNNIISDGLKYTKK